LAYISYLISLDPSNHEIQIAQLNLLGVESFIEHDHELEAFIETEKNPELENEIEIYLKENGFTFEKKLHDARDWNAEWEANFKPIEIGNELIVRAPFHLSDQKFAYELIIAPKMAFGTGHHETTSMILEWMLQEDIAGKDVLDFGCGTGILGIFAAKKNAASVCFIDNDPLATENTEENFKLNDLVPMEVKLGSYDVIPDKQYDLILANITRNILSEGMDVLSNHLKPKGKIVMSGFLIQDVEYMKEKMDQVGLMLNDQKIKGDWVCFIAGK
jgi:ribosomal protein L11 methyltransferase